MKKISRRAISVLLIAAAVIFGCVVYVLRYIDDGRSWALAFSSANSGSSGLISDRNGVVLARFGGGTNLYADDEQTRLSCYHALGDYTGATATGVINNFWDDMQGFSLVTGTTKAQSFAMSLNIDSMLNNTAYEALAGRNGAVLVMNYKNGELLCMVSSPSIDPLADNSNPPDGAYINRCLSSAYTPGSVFKLVTLAAAIENIPDIDSRSFYCGGSVDVSGVTVKCTGTHGSQTIEQALANSCNCAFAQISLELGADTLAKYAEALGFTQTQTLSGIETRAGSFDKAASGSADLAWSGIGQYTDLVCPYAMLRYVSAVANGGALAEPTLLLGATGGKTTLLESETARKIAGMMSYNVAYAYGAGTFPGLAMCAKSGTAETGDGTSHAWFTGFLDNAEHPYAFVVVIENGGGGLRNAGPVANSVLQAAVKKDYSGDKND